jgi:hypothetical protein
VAVAATTAAAAVVVAPAVAAVVVAPAVTAVRGAVLVAAAARVTPAAWPAESQQTAYAPVTDASSSLGDSPLASTCVGTTSVRGRKASDC